MQLGLTPTDVPKKNKEHRAALQNVLAYVCTHRGVKDVQDFKHYVTGDLKEGINPDLCSSGVGEEEIVPEQPAGSTDSGTSTSGAGKGKGKEVRFD